MHLKYFLKVTSFLLKTYLKAIENVLKHWSKCKLSLKGKITVINSLVISLLVYPASVLEVPHKVLDDINSLLYRFLWDGKRAKIASKILENNIKLGGLKMPNIFLKVKAWKFSWLKRAMLNPDSAWVATLNELTEKVSFTDLLKANPLLNSPLLNKLPIFYKEILTTWYELKDNFSGSTILKEMLWFNKNITIDRKPFFWEGWHGKGITLLQDILDENNQFLSVDALKEKYSLQTNFLSTLQIHSALPYA